MAKFNEIIRRLASTLFRLTGKVGVAVRPALRKSISVAGAYCAAGLNISGTALRNLFARTASLSKAEKALMDEAVAGENVVWLVRTGTRVDVGRWLSKKRVWLCLLPGRLVLFASGKRSVVESALVPELGQSRYNHVTGEIMLAPADNLTNSELRLRPLDGFELLSQIRQDDPSLWGVSIGDEFRDV